MQLFEHGPNGAGLAALRRAAPALDSILRAGGGQLIAATAMAKPIIALVDPDESRGGLSMEAIRTQLLEDVCAAAGTSLTARTVQQLLAAARQPSSSIEGPSLSTAAAPNKESIATLAQRIALLSPGAVPAACACRLSRIRMPPLGLSLL